MKFRPRLRKLVLAVHLTFSVGWIGGVVAYLSLGIAATTSRTASTIRAAWTGMELIGGNAIVPLAVASLATGILLALGTKWGLFRHYWVLISFVLTTIATVILILHMPDVRVLSAEAQVAEGAHLQALGGDLFHPGLGLVVLLAIQVLNIYKPPGLTRYGWRKQQN